MALIVAIDESVASTLPLMDLAVDLGYYYGRLVVASPPSPLVQSGEACVIVRDNFATIVLNRQRIRTEGRTLAEAWAHGLGHLLDFVDGRLIPMPASKRAHDRQERFADSITPLLLKHAPLDVASARPLMSLARHGRAGSQNPSCTPR